MSDLISRQAAMAYPLSWEHYDKEHGDSKFICGVESYREYIEHLPSADRPKGHWILDPNGYDWNLPAWVCSECHCKNDNIGVNLDRKSPLANPMMWAGSKFCPNCGANMRGENNER